MQSNEMGRIEKATAKPLMTSHEVAMYLLETCEALRDFESFMFGSSLIGIGNDYDILIIGPSDEPLTQLKEELRFAGKELPLDILYMLPEEAEETEFIKKEGCLALSYLANSGRA